MIKRRPAALYSNRRIAGWRSTHSHPSPITLLSSARSSRGGSGEGIFDKLREQNRGAERYSFLDGPITANNPMGVHHAWGRTLKDVFQRYKALRGFDQRYQNGFDCQGLWVEVEVEKALGLNSKRDIEEYGLAEFAERCKERVAEYSEVITDQDRRLGRWMDWDNDYYTFSDTNIEYIWRFLKAVHERGWLYKGPSLDAMVSALRHVALPARAGRRGELRGDRAPVALRSLPACRSATARR